ncbi:MAG: isoprenylcysteine carboxylmethyltransferase family protein, partial [Flavobacteriaceae bacterium]|nr:isoprenylcysteine carboxylmethyltransferase family protein [Flavobacteriaceae bacterium]
MNPPTILFYLLMALWFLSELYYKKRLISSKDDKKGKDKSTLNLLWIVIVLSIILANFSANIFLNAKIINHNWIVYCGLLFVFTGIFLRLVIIKSLGKYFTVDVTIKEHHELKKDGFYKIIRHP